jgi:hypothetical protein
MTASPVIERPSTASRRPTIRINAVARECLVVVATGFALAVVMTWPTLRHPTTTLAHNLVDAALMGWEVQWGWHALLHQPGQLFDANAFYPDPLSYAYSDTLLGYAPFGLLGQGPQAAVLAVNLIYVFACALASIGGYALARQLGASRLGSLVAGIAVAYAPWRWGHVGHLHVFSTGGIMLALAMLARGHGFSIRHGYRAERTHAGWVIGGWLVAAWQMTIGFGIGVPFAYALLGIGVLSVVMWFRRGRPPIARSVLAANVGGGLVFAGVSMFMARPYLKVVELFPYARRSPGEIFVYSPPWRAFFTGPTESFFWQQDHLGLQASLSWPPEMALLSGYILYALAICGLFVSVWSRRWRVALAAGVVVSMAFAMGIRFPPGGRLTYRLLHDYLPGFDGIRTPGRLVIWTTLLLSLLAAGAVTAMSERLTRSLPVTRSRHITFGHVAGLVAAALVLVEGLGALPNPVFPPAPAAMTAAYADTVKPPLLVLPSLAATDPVVMAWSTDGFPRMVNGLSGFFPASQSEIRVGTFSFPDAESVALLRQYGVKTVVVLRDWVVGTPWAGAPDAPVDGLGITRQEIADAVVFSL